MSIPGHLGRVEFISLDFDEHGMAYFRGFGGGHASLSPVPDDMKQVVAEFQAMVLGHVNPHDDGAVTMLDFQGSRFRVVQKSTSRGIWFTCRPLLDGTGTGELSLKTLRVNEHVSALMHEAGLRPGLVLVAGGPGYRKDSIAGATYLDWLRQHGETGYTVEVSPDFDLNGPYGVGWSHQVVVERTAIPWQISEVMKLSPRYLLVSEARTPAEVGQIIEAAHYGVTVVCSIRAFEIQNAVQRFVDLLAADAGMTQELALSLFAEHMIMVVHQLAPPKEKPRYTFACNNEPQVASLLSSGQFKMLSDVMRRQIEDLKAGRPIFAKIRADG